MHEPRVDSAGAGVRRCFDALCVALFAAALCAPTVDTWVRPDSARSPQLAERRLPAPRPELPRSGLDWLRFPERYQAFHKDSFGLRDRLLRWNSLVQVLVLGVSPSSQVYLGKQQWMMFRGNLALENRRGKLPWRPQDLDAWVDALKTRQSRLAAAGVRYLYVVAPDKESVYPEFLPDSVRPIGPTRLDAWLARLAQDAPQVEVLDLRGALIAHKRDDRDGDWLYNPYGTHWSGRGALVAVRAMLGRLRAMGLGFDVPALETFRREELEGGGDSWAESMYIGDVLVEHVYNYLPPTLRARVAFSGPQGVGRVRVSELEAQGLPRVMLMHDSFGLYVQKLLGELCSYLQGNWGESLDLREVQAKKPDVVVDLFVERMLNYAHPAEFLPFEETPWRERFAASSATLVRLDRSQPDWGLTAVGRIGVGPAPGAPAAGLPIAMRDPNDKLGLPDLSPVEGEVPVAHLVFDSPAEARLALWYRPRGEERFLRRNQYGATVRAGRNELFLPLSQPGTRGELLLRLGENLGDYTLFELEIRSVKAP